MFRGEGEGELGVGVGVGVGRRHVNENTRDAEYDSKTPIIRVRLQYVVLPRRWSAGQIFYT